MLELKIVKNRLLSLADFAYAHISRTRNVEAESLVLSKECFETEQKNFIPYYTLDEIDVIRSKLQKEERIASDVGELVKRLLSIDIVKDVNLGGLDFRQGFLFANESFRTPVNCLHLGLVILVVGVEKNGCNFRQALKLLKMMSESGLPMAS